jgi:membrane-associated phospholipid phosphatase
MALRPVERLLVVYLGFTTLLGLLRLPAQPAIGWVLLANLLSGNLIFLLSRAHLGTTGRRLRAIYPVLLLAALYPAIDILNGFGAVSVHDPAVLAWEHRLFGGDISRTWWQAAPSPFWSTVLHGAYFAYYAIVLAPVLVFALRGKTCDAERAVLWLIATFLTCYTLFLMYPVAGPYYEFPRPAAWFLDNAPARLVYATLGRGSAYGAAFPSSHVAAALVATAAAFRGSPSLGRLLVLPTVLLSVGVVYCQMHYAVDAVAGAAIGAVAIAVGTWWEKHGRVESGETAPARPPEASDAQPTRP